MTTATLTTRSSIRICCLLSLVLSLLVGGCSSFNREWKQAAVGQPKGIDGSWEGSWLSAKNGHHGQLRCVMFKFDDRNYNARFKATYWKILRIGYDVAILVERQPDGSFKLEGENDLGWWGGGVYRYDGDVTSTNFLSTYRSKYDHGTFQLKRPAP